MIQFETAIDTLSLLFVPVEPGMATGAGGCVGAGVAVSQAGIAMVLTDEEPSTALAALSVVVAEFTLLVDL